jgi:CMP-N,N'-diacetyllegionaminic acid synthase
MNVKTYCFDLDGTLCSQIDPENYGEGADPSKIYELAVPFENRIKIVNSLYDEGNIVLIDTARGSKLGNKKHWSDVTKKQLKLWGVKYHKLRVGKKLVADVYIDDRGIHDSLFFDNE